MNIGFWICIVLDPCFLIMGLFFGILKEKAAKFVSGFNSIPAKEQKLYDKASISRDMRNSSFLWTLVMLIGALCSFFIEAYFAIIAYVVWGILFFKDVHIDAHRAFHKYFLK